MAVKDILVLEEPNGTLLDFRVDPKATLDLPIGHSVLWKRPSENISIVFTSTLQIHFLIFLYSQDLLLHVVQIMSVQ